MIHVHNVNDQRHSIDADTWHVDDFQNLHLKKNAKPVASFAAGKWIGVEEIKDGE